MGLNLDELLLYALTAYVVVLTVIHYVLIWAWSYDEVLDEGFDRETYVKEWLGL